MRMAERYHAHKKRLASIAPQGGTATNDASQNVGAMRRRRGVQRAALPIAFGFGTQRGRVKVAIEIFQTEVGLMSNLNELIACKNSGKCAVVDPAFEVDRLLKEAKTRGWTVVAVLVTHTHHDH